MRNKMLKTQMLVLCFLTMLVSSFAFAEGQMKLSLNMATTKFIAGEPMECLLTLENNGDDTLRVAYNTSFSNPCIRLNTKGPVNGKCATKWYPEMGFGYVGLLPKEAKNIKYDLHSYGVGLPGDYEVWVEYNTLSLGDEWSQIGVPRVKIESNHVSFKITEPEGIDLEVFQKYHSNCNQITLTPSDLLQKYPTSTYAGYALYQHAPTLGYAKLDVLDNTDEALNKWCNRGQPSEDFNKRKQETLQQLSDYAEKIKMFLDANPKFIYADTLRKRLAVCLGLNNRMAEAMQQLELLSKGAGKEAEEAKDYLSRKNEKKVETSTPKTATTETK